MEEKSINKPFINKEILTLFLALAWPTVVEEFLSTIIQYIDTAMVGRLGPSSTATVSLSSTHSWLINSVIYAIGIGFLSYVARAVGEKNQKKIKLAAGQAVYVVIAIGLVLTVITMLLAPFIPVWMGAEQEIRHNASIYYALINSPLIFRAAMIIFGSIIRATGDTKSPMIINLLVNLINMGLNYVFIYALSFGAVGAGIATAISFVIGGILMTLVFIRKDIISFDRQSLIFDRATLWECLKIGIPVMFTQMASCFGYVVATSMVSSMPTVIFAAHSIAITAETIFYIPGYGMQAATSTLIGNSIGEQNFQKAKDVMRASLFVIFLLMIISGILLYLGAGFMMSLFTKDQQVIEIGSRLLKIVAFTEPVFGSAAVLEGIYDGMGRTKFPFVATLISRWGVRILGAYIFIKCLGYGINQYWYCMIGDNILKALLLLLGLLVILKRKLVIRG